MQRMMQKANKIAINLKAINPDLVKKELRIQEKHQFALPFTMPSQIQARKSLVQFSVSS